MTVRNALLPAHGRRCNHIDYSFFFFVIFLSLFAIPSLAVMLAGAVASEPDLAAAPPLVPLAPPVWANAALEKATAAAAILKPSPERRCANNKSARWAGNKTFRQEKSKKAKKAK